MFTKPERFQESCNEHGDLNVSLALYTTHSEQRRGEWAVHRVLAIKIYNTFDRSTVKIHGRSFVSCSRAKTCNFSGFANIHFVLKLSSRKFPRWTRYATVAINKENKVVCENTRVTQLLLYADWPEQINQKQPIQTILELIR